MTRKKDEVAAALEALREADGMLSIEAVVDAAGLEDSVLHKHFEWNDGTAGHLYRLEQARALIRTLKIPVKLGPVTVNAPRFIPAINSVGTYRRLDEVVPGSEDARDLILTELGRMMGSIERVRRVALVIGMQDEVDHVMASLAGLREKVSEPA
ncbi:MAG TPA: hypothetical protein VK602_15065 [Phyllobacterium sp.]|nr:hypothetical protein [Phyllobacterium sp.]